MLRFRLCCLQLVTLPSSSGNLNKQLFWGHMKGPNDWIKLETHVGGYINETVLNGTFSFCSYGNWAAVYSKALGCVSRWNVFHWRRKAYMMEGFVWKSLFCFVFFFRKLVCEFVFWECCCFYVLLLLFFFSGVITIPFIHDAEIYQRTEANSQSDWCISGKMLSHQSECHEKGPAQRLCITLSLPW